MDITFAIDISHHQDKNLDLARTRRDGCELCLIKAGEGASFVDPDFASNLTEARAAGQLTAAYWYQRANTGAEAHVARIRQVVPRDVAIVVDVEANSGGVALTRDIIARLRSAGYVVPWTYLPRWYWQQIGSPSLAGLPPLWSSRYPDNVVGTLPEEWDDVLPSYWNGYGGLDVGLLQFTSSARIAGYAPLDASAYRGTRAQLATVLRQTGGNNPPATRRKVSELMERKTIDASPDTKPVRLWLSGSDTAAIIIRPRIDSSGLAINPVWLGNIFAWGSDKAGIGHNPMDGRASHSFNKITAHHRHELPGAVWADFEYSSLDPFEIDIVG